MILRRLVAAFRRQDWFTVLVETMIVVFGVFIGLQVSNWNAARQDRAREEVYLARIAEDLRADIVEIDEIHRVSTVRISALDFLIWKAAGRAAPDGFSSARGRIAIETAPPFSEEASGSAGIALFILTTLEGNRTAYETMINTGAISLIRDARLLREVQDYYATADSVRDFEISLKESRVTLVDAQQEAGISPVDATTAADLAAAFSKDERISAAAKNYWLYTNRHLKLMTDLRRKADALIERLEGSAP